MAVTITKYTHAHKILCGAGDWTTDTIKLALIANTYTFSAAHTAWADVSANELASGDGYTTGGATLSTSKTDALLDAVDVTFSSLDKTFEAGVVYIVGTVEAITNPVLFYILFDDTAGGTEVTIPGVDFSVIWNASGIATL